MAWRFDAATDKVLVASGWTGSVATILMWVRRVTDRGLGSNPWRAWSNAAGGGSTVAGIGSDGGGDTIVTFDSAFSNLTGPSLVGNTWHCVALVMNGTAWSLYHGSDPSVLTVATGTKANATSPGSWTLVDSPDFLAGDIAGVKLFSRALSAAEVAAELADPGQVSASSLTWRGTLATSSTTPETGTTMTAGGTAIAVVEGPALPAASTTTVGATAAARLVGVGTSATTISATAAAVAAPPPLAAYGFDGITGTTVADDSGNGHSWSLAGGAAVSGSGHTGSGLTTDGTGVTSTVGSPAFGQTASRTVMCWMINPASVTQWVVRWNVVSIDSGAWGILILGSTVVAQARNAGGFTRAVATRPTDGLWHHYAGTYDGTSVRFYLDGVLVDTQTLTAPMRTDADTIDIGEWTDTTTVVDDLRMHDSALSAAQIAALAATPVPAIAVTGGGTSATTISATAAGRTAGSASSATTISATAAAQVVGGGTSATTISATAAVRLVGTAGSITTWSATAAARGAGTASSATTIGATAAGTVAGAVGGGTSATAITASAAGRLIAGAVASTTIGATAAASGTVGAASVSVIAAVALAHDLTPPAIPGGAHGGVLTMAGARHGSALALSSGLRAVAS